MEITLNGEKKMEVPPAAVLASVFPELGIELTTPGIAVAVNSRVVSKSRWQVYVLKEGDKIEVVKAFQGG
jgi:sulfur carrier protein